MYPSNVKFVYSAAGLVDNEQHTVMMVNAASPLDSTIDRALILTLSTHYDTVTVLLRGDIPDEVTSLKKRNAELLKDIKMATSSLKTTNAELLLETGRLYKTFVDDARPTCADGNCTCETCAGQREWDDKYDTNSGVLK